MSNEAMMDQPATGEATAIRIACGDVPPSADDSPTTAEMKLRLLRLGQVLQTDEFKALKGRLTAGEINREQFERSLARLTDAPDER